MTMVKDFFLWTSRFTMGQYRMYFSIFQTVLQVQRNDPAQQHGLQNHRKSWSDGEDGQQRIQVGAEIQKLLKDRQNQFDDQISVHIHTLEIKKIITHWKYDQMTAFWMKENDKMPKPVWRKLQCWNVPSTIQWVNWMQSGKASGLIRRRSLPSKKLCRKTWRERCANSPLKNIIWPTQ